MTVGWRRGERGEGEGATVGTHTRGHRAGRAAVQDGTLPPHIFETDTWTTGGKRAWGEKTESTQGGGTPTHPGSSTVNVARSSVNRTRMHLQWAPRGGEKAQQLRGVKPHDDTPSVWMLEGGGLGQVSPAPPPHTTPILKTNSHVCGGGATPPLGHNNFPTKYGRGGCVGCAVR